jgi:hypothetical protein
MFSAINPSYTLSLFMACISILFLSLVEFNLLSSHGNQSLLLLKAHLNP